MFVEINNNLDPAPSKAGITIIRRKVPLKAKVKKFHPLNKKCSNGIGIPRNTMP